MSIGEFADGKVTVRKAELLEKIKVNREAHNKAFLATMKLYRGECVRVLEATLDDARTGKDIRLKKVLELIAPQDHTSDYDRVINMLGMATSELVTITEQQFSHYVLDEWGWKGTFEATRQRYGS